jgi:hypothetical protein
MSAVRQLEPGHRQLAPPPRREVRNKLKPATAFRIPAGRAQLRHPRRSPVGDLDPENRLRLLPCAPTLHGELPCGTPLYVLLL